jgi:hypothetical protein
MSKPITMRLNLFETALNLLYELEADWRWMKDVPRCGYQEKYKELCMTITALENVRKRF